MKRLLCTLLAALSGPALSAQATSWIDLHYAELESEAALFPPDSEEGRAFGLAFAYATSATGYFRIDFRRQRLEGDVPELVVGDEPLPGAFITTATVFDVPEWTGANERNIQTITAGLVSPFNQGIDLIGEIGIAKLEAETSGMVATLGSDPAVIESVTRQTVVASETGAIVRLGLQAQDGGVRWGATGEWFSKLPPFPGGATGEADSGTWWNAYIGYNFTPSMALNLRYEDTEDFTSRGLALRWSF